MSQFQIMSSFRATAILASFAFSGLATAAAPTPERCGELQLKLDRLESVDELTKYLRADVPDQRELDDLFQCLAGEQTSPTEHVTGTARTFIRGNGWGSLIAFSGVPFWNELQSRVGSLIWAGKIFQRQDDGTVTLLNMMSDRKTMAYAANVVELPSIVDGQPAIVLDYRKDDTQGVLSTQVVSRVRDEIREIRYRGVGTRVFIGRANLFVKPLEARFSDVWTATESFVFAANFFLDFRPEQQENIPEWALSFYEGER